MIKHVVAAVKRALKLNRPGRELVILPDDIFLVSFPKSGNTWTRFLLANLLHPEEPATFANIHQMMPDPTGTTKRDFDRMSRPRIIKSHDCFDPRLPRVVYVVRDPRDVAVSQYHYHRKLRKIGDQSRIEEFVDRFLVGKTCPHGSWGQNVLTWVATAQDPARFLLLRYEDMIEDTARELRKVAVYLNLDAGPERIAQAVERSSASRMRKLEQKGSDQCDLTRDTRKDLSFVRSASSGGWKSELPPVLAEKIEAAWGPLMQHLGYELVSQPAAEAREFDPLKMLSTTSR